RRRRHGLCLDQWRRPRPRQHCRRRHRLHRGRRPLWLPDARRAQAVPRPDARHRPRHERRPRRRRRRQHGHHLCLPI
ncbi:hypothetical protein H4R21_002538, partial [Coemansia helicoidea]